MAWKNQMSTQFSFVSSAGFHFVATTTHIFDGGILVNLALQVLEDALPE
jgi:hypothetical protein